MTDTNMLIMLMPLIILQFALMIGALVHIFRHHTYRVGNRLIWVLVVVLINFIGPIMYFIFGKGK